MELYTELLAYCLSKEHAEIRFPDLELNADAIIDKQCYHALKNIREIILDDTINDSDCFLKIEEIICVLEKLGVFCGNRHDFG